MKMPLSESRYGTKRGTRATQVVRIAVARNGSIRSLQPDVSLVRMLLITPTVMKLTTLADGRDLFEKHLPAPYHRKSIWQLSQVSLPRPRKARRICSKFAYHFA